MKINLELWNQDRKTLEQSIRETKKEMHQPWTEAVACAQSYLEDQKIEATAMYIFRSKTRGRIGEKKDRPHPQGKHVENVNERMLNDALKEFASRYALPVSDSAVVEPTVPGERTA